MRKSNGKIERIGEILPRVMADTKKRSERWKTLERDVAAALGGRRIVEPWFLFRERPDVVKDLPNGGRLIIDCKAFKKSAANTLLESTKAKYCTAPDDIPVAIIKTPGRSMAVAIIPLDFLAELLNPKEPTS